MFGSWGDAIVFAIFVTFFTGVIASVVARVDLNKMNKSQS